MFKISYADERSVHYFDYNQNKFTFTVSSDNMIQHNACKKRPCLSENLKFDDTAGVQNEEGYDPAFINCTEKLNGAPFQLHDGNNNQESVCIFKDGSMVTFGSIRISP